MDIRYRESYRDNFIREDQINEIRNYRKSYFNEDILVKEDIYSDSELMGLYYYNYESINHQIIIENNKNIANYKWISIIEFQNFKDGFKLKKRFGYNVTGIFNGINLEVYNKNGDLIAFGYSDANGNPEHDRTKKMYWNRDLNPNDYIFECTFRQDTGELLELYWNNFHLDDTGQESFALWNTPEDIEELIKLTGMSRELAEYYMSPEIIPNF